MVGRHDVQLYRLSVRPDGVHLEGDREPAPGNQVVEQGPDRLDAVAVEQLEGIEPDGVAGVVSEHPLGRCTDEGEPAVGADDGDHVELPLAQRVEARLAGGPAPLERASGNG